MLLMAPHDAGNFISQLEIRGKELCVICFNEFFLYEKRRENMSKG
jgi:hypothetical protein